jgi:hypothetical protein
MKEEVVGRGGEGRGRASVFHEIPYTWEPPTPWANSMINFCSSIHILLGHELKLLRGLPL